MDNDDNIIIKEWSELNLKDNLLRGIYAYGFEQPSEIQKKAILPIINKRDVIAQAQSGSGKTGTFSISSLQRVDTTKNCTQIIILATTHELALQIYKVLTSLGSFIDGLVVKTLIGGTSVQEDIKQIHNKTPHIVIGTIGRTIDMIKKKIIYVDSLDLLILDEADEMLSGTFKDNIQSIIQKCSNQTNICIFSATLPDYILQLTDKFMNDPYKTTMINIIH